MLVRCSKRFAIALGGAMVFIPTTTLVAQSLWLDRSADRYVAIEWLKPSLNGDDGSFATSVTFISFRYQVRPGIAVEVDLPFTHFGVGSFDGSPGFSETSLGNPYLGVLLGRRDMGFSSELGLRLPFMPDEEFFAQTIGLLTDVDRWEAFVNDIVPVSTLASYAWRGPTGFIARVRAGPSFWIPLNGDGEVMFDYATQVGYQGSRFRATGGFSGSLAITEADLNFGERTLHEFGVASSVRLGRLRPGVHFRLPLDRDLRDALNAVVGFQLGVALGR